MNEHAAVTFEDFATLVPHVPDDRLRGYFRELSDHLADGRLIDAAGILRLIGERLMELLILHERTIEHVWLTDDEPRLAQYHVTLAKLVKRKAVPPVQEVLFTSLQAWSLLRHHTTALPVELRRADIERLLGMVHSLANFVLNRTGRPVLVFDSDDTWRALLAALARIEMSYPVTAFAA